MNPLYTIDFYKVGHIKQYPKGITKVWSNWTPRSSRVPERQGLIHFGLQYLILKYLIEDIQTHFFSVPKSIAISEYRDFMAATLGDTGQAVHIAALHDLGYVPLEIFSVPEGTFVPCGVPALAISNTLPQFYWLPNYFETLLSNILWQASTSATTATIFREIFEKAARKFGETDLRFVDYQGHDFSMRGMGGIEAAQLSGMGHLLSFKGTDTVPAILAASKYYGIKHGDVGGSVPATEHSVMSAGGMADEFETFKRLITETYPTGIVSIVSDTWDLWKVLTDFIPRLKETILARDGTVVIRPDSGSPVDIMIGNPNSGFGPERAGVLRLLADTMGTDNHGHINKMKAIYGDGISPARATAICEGAIAHKLSPFNWLAGIGSYSYQFVTRDTYGLAMKATAVQKDDKVIPIFKDPVTDTDSLKKSHYGIPLATYRLGSRNLEVLQNVTPNELRLGAFKEVFCDGEIIRSSHCSFKDIRETVRSNQY